jgi:hypothetical protein
VPPSSPSRLLPAGRLDMRRQGHRVGEKKYFYVDVRQRAPLEYPSARRWLTLLTLGVYARHARNVHAR